MIGSMGSLPYFLRVDSSHQLLLQPLLLSFDSLYISRVNVLELLFFPELELPTMAFLRQVVLLDDSLVLPPRGNDEFGIEDSE